MLQSHLAEHTRKNTSIFLFFFVYVIWPLDNCSQKGNEVAYNSL